MNVVYQILTTTLLGSSLLLAKPPEPAPAWRNTNHPRDGWWRSTITTPPTDQSVAAGESATFSVKATGNEPFSYQWSRNGKAIDGATSATYTTPATSPADNGTIFKVRITNAVGRATSRTATLTVMATNHLVKDVYVYSDIATDASARSAFFGFAQRKGLQRMYLETAYLDDGSHAALVDLLGEAETRQIQTTLLYGNQIWALTANHAAALERATQALKLASELHASGKTAPDTIQFDVEPYLLPDWGTDLQGTANQYLDLLDKLHATLAGSLRLTVAIPFWFDSQMITRNGQTRPLSEWVIDATDGTVMMDYRDTAVGLLDCSSSELAYAASKSKSVVLAVDTMGGSDSGQITFCEEGEAAMEKELATTKAALVNQKGFGGFAVFAYDYWKVMKP